jgi:hypothetical protein
MNSSIFTVGIIALVGILWYSWVIADKVMTRVTSLSGTMVLRSFGWYRQLACRLLLVVVAVTPFVILGNIVISAPAQTAVYGDLGHASNLELENLDQCPSQSGAKLYLTMRNLDSTRNIAEVEIFLCVGDQALKNLTLVRTGVRPLSKSLTTSGKSASFLRSTFRVSYLGSIPEINFTRAVTIGSILRQVDNLGPRRPVDLGIFGIPLVGDAANYPFDNYSMAGVWTVFVPSNMQVAINNSVGIGWIPASIDVAAIPDAGNIAWKWGYIRGLGDAVEADRTYSLKSFVMLLVALPLLLFIGLLALVRSIIGNSPRYRFPAELLVGVGAFLLAIIPIRAVLVPADFSQITVTDYILGTEMAVIVASSLMIVAAGSMKPRTKPVGVQEEEADGANGSVASASVMSEIDAGTVAGENLTGRLIGILLTILTGIAAVLGARRLLRRAEKDK